MARWKIHLKKPHLLRCNFLIQQPIDVGFSWIFIPCKTHRLDKDQVAMAGGSLTSMWDIRELLSAFPDLEEVSLVKIDAAAWLILGMECPKDDDFFRCLARHWPNTFFLIFLGGTWGSGLGFLVIFGEFGDVRRAVAHTSEIERLEKIQTFGNFAAAIPFPVTSCQNPFPYSSTPCVPVGSYTWRGATLFQYLWHVFTIMIV